MIPFVSEKSDGKKKSSDGKKRSSDGKKKITDGVTKNKDGKKEIKENGNDYGENGDYGSYVGTDPDIMKRMCDKMPNPGQNPLCKDYVPAPAPTGCTSGETKGEGCATCTCSDDGRWLCTGFCPPGVYLEKYVSVLKSLFNFQVFI